MDARRQLPAMGEILEEPAMRALGDAHGRTAVKEIVRRELDELRRGLSSDALSDEAASHRLRDLPAIVDAELSRRTLSLRRVINATGVVLHTNLGRAPLSMRAIEALRDLGAGYLNVEIDLATGVRGGRASGIDEKLRALTGCEASLVANNNAAAVLLMLDTVARAREVIVSRGELVEIGGAFRVPDVMARSGARLVEVGTTNRTRIADYERAVTDETAALLKVHPSNFRIVGFTEEASPLEVTRLARERGVVSLFDLGSGAIRLGPTVRGESTVRDALDAGFDLVSFSGDKLLGGPQAGIVVGRKELVEKLRKNPLYRALRVDKVTLVLLEATLDSYVREREDAEVPAQSLLATSLAALEDRVARVIADLGPRASELGAASVAVDSAVGGGSAPLDRIPSRALSLAPAGIRADTVLAWLREASPAIVARIQDDAVLLDFRTIFIEQDALVLAALTRPLP